MNDKELAWAAGLFAGEGHISTRKRKSGKQPELQLGLAMNDERSVRRFARIISPYVGPRQGGFRMMTGCSVKQYVNRRTGNRFWSVALSSGPAVPVAEALLHHLRGTDKGDQIQQALAGWHNRREACA